MRQLSGPKIYKILPCWKDEAEVEMLLREVDLAAAATRSRFARDESPATGRSTPLADHWEMHASSDAPAISCRGWGRWQRRPRESRSRLGCTIDGMGEGEMLPVS